MSFAVRPKRRASVASPMMSPASDTFDPTPRDAATIGSVDLVLLNGGLDELLHELVEASRSKALVLETLTALGPFLEGTSTEDGASEDERANTQDHAGINPHVWLDPLLTIRFVPMIAEALSEVDPENAERYRADADRVVVDLEALHEEMLVTLADVRGVPFHDAWPYFADRYGLYLVLEIEPFPGREPSPRYLANAVKAIRESGARVIFNEAQLNDRPARVLAAEAGVELATLDPLGGAGERTSYEGPLLYDARTTAEVLGD
jgi:zinc transport system substrate-binding protein